MWLIISPYSAPNPEGCEELKVPTVHSGGQYVKNWSSVQRTEAGVEALNPPKHLQGLALVTVWLMLRIKAYLSVHIIKNIATYLHQKHFEPFLSKWVEEPYLISVLFSLLIKRSNTAVYESLT